MAGMGHAPLWLARAAATEGRKRKTLVAIFLRGAADGLNIVVPFGDPAYRRTETDSREYRPPRPGDDNDINGPFGSAIDLDGKFGLHPGLRPLKALWDRKQLAIVEATGSPRSLTVALRRTGLHGVRYARQGRERLAESGAD